MRSRTAIAGGRRRPRDIDPSAMTSADRPTLLELVRVEVGYHGTPVLPPVDLAITAGDAVGIVGPNGSGKTTLVRTMLGLLRPVRGAVTFPLRRRPRFGYVPQRAAVDSGFPLTAL